MKRSEFLILTSQSDIWQFDFDRGVQAAVSKLPDYFFCYCKQP
jgi:hypothetical protein